MRVLPLLLRPRQSGLEDVLVANPRQASMLAKLVGVDRINDNSAKPVWLASALGHCYFASSRSALRYFLAALAAIFKARSA